MSTQVIRGEGLPAGGVKVEAEEDGFRLLIADDAVESLLEVWEQEHSGRGWSMGERTFAVAKTDGFGNIPFVQFWDEYEPGVYDVLDSPFDWTANEIETASIKFVDRTEEERTTIRYIELENLVSPFEIRVNGETVYQRGIDF